jgi:hypothetical protein
MVGIIETIEPATPTSPDAVILTDGRRRDFDRRELIDSPHPEPGELMLSGELNGEPWIAFLAPPPPSPVWGGERPDCWSILAPAWRDDGFLHFKSTIRLPLADDFEPGSSGHINYYVFARFCVSSRGEVVAYLSRS